MFSMQAQKHTKLSAGQKISLPILQSRAFVCKIRAKGEMLMKKFLKRLLLIAFAILLFLYLLGSCVGSSDDDSPQEDANAPQSESISQPAEDLSGPETPPTEVDAPDAAEPELPPAFSEEVPQTPDAEMEPEAAPEVVPEVTAPAASDSTVLPNTARFLGKKGSTNGPDTCRRTTGRQAGLRSLFRSRRGTADPVAGEPLSAHPHRLRGPCG